MTIHVAAECIASIFQKTGEEEGTYAISIDPNNQSLTVKKFRGNAVWKIVMSPPETVTESRRTYNRPASLHVVGEVSPLAFQVISTLNSFMPKNRCGE